MKILKKIIGTLLVICICVMGVHEKKAQAIDLYKYYQYRKSDKLYDVHKKYKGYEMSYKKSYCYYQVMKMTKSKIMLKAQSKWVYSDDPVFGGKTKTCKLASDCKFYYSNAAFPGKVSGDEYIRYYKRVPKSVVKKSLKTGDKGDRFFGEVYVKKGKVIAIACYGGD